MLPTEIYLQIFSYLDVNSLQNIALTCKHYYNIIKNNKKYLITLIRSKQYNVKDILHIIDEKDYSFLKLPLWFKERFSHPTVLHYDISVVKIYGKLYPVGKGFIYGYKEDAWYFCIGFEIICLKTKLFPKIIQSYYKKTSFMNNFRHIYLQLSNDITKLNLTVQKQLNDLNYCWFYLVRTASKDIGISVYRNYAVLIKTDKYRFTIWNSLPEKYNEFMNNPCLDTFIYNEVENITSIELYENNKTYKFTKVDNIEYEKEDYIMFSNIDPFYEGIYHTFCCFTRDWTFILLKNPIIDNMTIPSTFKFSEKIQMT